MSKTQKDKTLKRQDAHSPALSKGKFCLIKKSQRTTFSTEVPFLPGPMKNSKNRNSEEKKL